MLSFWSWFVAVYRVLGVFLRSSAATLAFRWDHLNSGAQPRPQLSSNLWPQQPSLPSSAVPCSQLFFLASTWYCYQLRFCNLPSLPPSFAITSTTKPSIFLPLPALPIWCLGHRYLRRHLVTDISFSSAPTLFHNIFPDIKFSPSHCVQWKIVLPKIYSRSDADNWWRSDVDRFPSLHSLVKICLNMKPDTNFESSHLWNGRSIAKIKMNLSKSMSKTKPSSCTSTIGALKKQADNLMIELGSDLAKLNENFNVFF